MSTQTPRQLLEQHGSIRKAAAAAGVARSTFFEALQQGRPTAKAKRPAMPGPRSSWRTTIAAARQQKKSIRTMASELGVPRSTLFDLMVTYKVP